MLELSAELLALRVRVGVLLLVIGDLLARGLEVGRERVDLALFRRHLLVRVTAGGGYTGQHEHGTKREQTHLQLHRDLRVFCTLSNAKNARQGTT